ncbi:MAG: ATP-binding cassette domain-containing protein, partial [Streptococcus sp.]|nr:ATP-binding cassette domain-containing protein [Streptococcus sp.]
ENMAIAYRRGKKRSFFKKSITESERQVFKEALVDLGLGLENRMKTDANFLSGGQRQALTLAMATLVRPKILLLDEHTAALDPKTSVALMELTDDFVSKDHLTALMITHHMEDALKYGNRLIVMKEGRIIQDLNKEEKAQMKISDYYQLFE